MTESRQDNRKYHIRVTGVTLRNETPEQEMSFMIEYDNAVIETITTTVRAVIQGIYGETRVRMFTADIWSEHFTPDRWHSFGLTATALNDTVQYNYR